MHHSQDKKSHIKPPSKNNPEKENPDPSNSDMDFLHPPASRRPPIGGTATFLMVFAVRASDIGVRRYRRDGRRGPGGGRHERWEHDPGAARMPGVRARGGGAGPAPREAAVDPPGMPEPAPGGAEEGTGTRTPHVAGVAPDGIQERRRRGGRRTAPAGGMAQRGRRPSRPRDGRTVLLVGQMHGGAHAARTGNAHGIRGPVGRGPGPVHRPQGHGPDRGPDRLEGVHAHGPWTRP